MAYTTYGRDELRFGSVRGYFANLKRRFADYRQYRRTLDELSALSERELADLQLSRFSIKTVAWESVYGA
jgi:uncharacterized protein YjiS (DUF1127 family)